MIASRGRVREREKRKRKNEKLCEKEFDSRRLTLNLLHNVLYVFLQRLIGTRKQSQPILFDLFEILWWINSSLIQDS